MNTFGGNPISCSVASAVLDVSRLLKLRALWSIICTDIVFALNMPKILFTTSSFRKSYT